MPEEISKIRSEIDELDNQIVDLLSKRILYVEKIGHYKHRSGQVIADKQREAEILDRLSQQIPANQIADIRAIYEIIFKRSKQRQEITD